jgi:hypothetical protein
MIYLNSALSNVLYIHTYHPSCFLCLLPILHNPPSYTPPQPISYTIIPISQSPSHNPNPILQPIYPIAFKKFFSLICARRLFRIALVNSSRAPAASTAPATVPSPAGKSMVCSYRGILGTSSSGFARCSFRSRFAARRRCFLDFAGERGLG